MINSSLVKAASFNPRSLQHPNAWVGHTPFAYWIIQEISPNIFVELGTHTGNSYFTFCQSVANAGLSTRCYSVDTWKGDEHAGQYEDDIFNKVYAHHQKNYEEFSRLLRTTFDEALDYFADESIDLLHIDGLHTYEAVRHDFESWLPKLTPGAIVMLHDTNVRENNFGVWKFWEELKTTYPNNLEFIHSHGLGVLQLNNPKENKKINWLEPACLEKQAIISFFAALGSRQLDRFKFIEETNTLNEKLKMRQDLIEILNQSIHDYNNKVKELTQTLIESYENTSKINELMMERDTQISILNLSALEKKDQIISLGIEIQDRKNQIDVLLKETSERDYLIQSIISSESWQITKPMRWLGRHLRSLFSSYSEYFPRKTSKQTTLTSNDCNTDQLMIEFCALESTSPIKPTHPVAVIVPVYHDVELTERCILSAFPDIEIIPDARIIIINDASPDDGMQEMLEKLTSQWPSKCEVLNNEINLGFVGTVNRGLAYCQKYDVVLLNSDVLVPDKWLQRLINEAYSRSDIGTVTPMSNNATICSFPYFLQENKQLFNLDVNSIDAAFKSHELKTVSSPTGVGFCMYIRRDCLNDIGYLNQEKFSRGYGEENDLCQRAINSGWLNIITPNIYAYHEGSVSFSSEKKSLVEQATQVIGELHPDYHAQVQEFINKDPLRTARIERYQQVLAITTIPKILHISHNFGGGVAQHIEELAQFLTNKAAHILLTPSKDHGEVSISLGVNAYADKLNFRIPSRHDELIQLLKNIGLSAVHFHHTAGIDSSLLTIPHELNIPHFITVHDYYLMHGNPTLTNSSGVYPGYYSEKTQNPSYPLTNEMTPQQWQSNYITLIERAAFVIFPSTATRALFNQVYNTPNAITVPHIEEQLNVNRAPLGFKKKDTYIIGALGALSREKGADLLAQLAGISNILGLKLSFKLIGYAYKPLNHVLTTGPYNNKDLRELIQNSGLDLILFPSQCPETYSYTLSSALDSGLPIIAPHIGAFPERLAGRENCFLFNHLSPPNEILEQINDFIFRLADGAYTTAPIYENNYLRHDFYTTEYLTTASLKLP